MTDDNKQFKAKINSGKIDDIIDALSMIIGTAKELTENSEEEDAAYQASIMLLCEILELKRQQIFKQEPILVIGKGMMKLVAKELLR